VLAVTLRADQGRRQLGGCVQGACKKAGPTECLLAVSMFPVGPPLYSPAERRIFFHVCLGAALRLAQPEHRVLLEDWRRAQGDGKLFKQPARFLSRAQMLRIFISGTLVRGFAKRIRGTCILSKDFSIGARRY